VVIQNSLVFEKKDLSMKELSLPDGVKHLTNSLYLVKFDLLRLADRPETSNGEYKFSNPRGLTQAGEAVILDKEQSQDIRKSIKDRGLMNPLVARWVKEDDGNYYPQLVGGERRYRAISYLISKKEMVRDTSKAKFNTTNNCFEYEDRPADLVYAEVLMQVYVAKDDLEALAYAYDENACRVNLSEGHDVAMLVQLRQAKASDEQILNILHKKVQWLRETDKLIANLDLTTLNNLIEGNIAREAAQELLKVENIDTRLECLQRAKQASEIVWHDKIEKIQKQVENCEEELELARADKAVAGISNEAEEIAQAEEVIEKAEQKLERTKKDRDTVKPVVKSKQARKAIKDVSGEEVAGNVNNCLREPKIRKFYYDYLDQMIQNEGRDESLELEIPVDTLNFAFDLIKGILDGNTEVTGIIQTYQEFLVAASTNVSDSDDLDLSGGFTVEE
jgi:uncharacterized protein YheU (UPF0270 family)